MMASRLWYAITWPSAIITLGIGTSMIINQPQWLKEGFMHIKLTLVFLLYLYHFSLHIIFKQLRNDVVKFSSQQLRFWNEVATLFLINIVFIVVLKSALLLLPPARQRSAAIPFSARCMRKGSKEQHTSKW